MLEESHSTSGSLTALGVICPSVDLPASRLRFEDGAECRVEIPSVEGPECLRVVREASAALSVPVARVSQGSGVTLLSDEEIMDMVSIAAGMSAELSLFSRPNAGWGASVMARSPAGAVVAPCAYGQGQLAAAVGEIRRAADLGVRSVLIADLGVLSVFGELRRSGQLPADMIAKVSVMLPAANAAAAKVLVGLGAGTINVPSDLALAELACIRAAVDVPLDLYIESPDNLGGCLRYHELPAIVETLAPVYLKFGLRNAPDVYPSGSQFSELNSALCLERVRRARLGLDLLQRERPGSRVTHPLDEQRRR